MHLGKHIKDLHERGIVARFEEHDLDGYPDYTIWLPDKPEKAYRIECKNVRDTEEAYRKKGQIVAFKVETQKTRASKGDLSSRHYSFGQFEILAVCLGKKTLINRLIIVLTLSLHLWYSYKWNGCQTT